MKILIVDDENSIRKVIRVALQSDEHEIEEADSIASALACSEAAPFDIGILDLKLGDESGLDLLPGLLESNPEMDVVVLTAHGSIETAVEALKLGAAEFVTKPMTPEQLRQIVRRVGKAQRLKGRLQSLTERLTSETPGVDLHTEEPSLQQVYEQAMKAADSAATILLLGESGTGKSVLARAIHERSSVADKEFVTVSCPSLSRELLESELFGHIKGSFTGAVRDTWGKVAHADGGSLFLDEIGELPMEIQPKLLRLLQEREYERLGEHKTHRANVRVIAATNQNLEALVEEKKFREDLFYRLNVITLHLPPLRNRRKDLMRLAEGYLSFFAKQCVKPVGAFSDPAREWMLANEWKGNLRELRNVIERAVIMASGDQIEISDLPGAVNGAGSAIPANTGQLVTLQALEREHIRAVVERTETLDEAATVLGIDPATLYRKRKKLFPEELEQS